MENLSVENYFIEVVANGKEPHICETYNDIEDALLRLEIQYQRELLYYPRVSFGAKLNTGKKVMLMTHEHRNHIKSGLKYFAEALREGVTYTFTAFDDYWSAHTEILNILDNAKHGDSIRFGVQLSDDKQILFLNTSTDENASPMFFLG